jgi:hypothetical protein
MDKEDVSHTAFAFIAGATVGAGVMLLLTPQAGSEFRSSVRDYTQRAKDEWGPASERGVNALETLFQRGIEWIQRALPKQGTGGGREIHGTEGALGSAQQRDHTAGNTGQDNLNTVRNPCTATLHNVLRSQVLRPSW